MMRRLRSFRVAALGALIVLGASGAVAGSSVEIGMNYDWWRFAAKTQDECRAHPGSAFHGNWLLPQYQNESVRDAVKTQLRQMHDAGFTLLKILVLHRRPHLGGAVDFFLSADGSLASSDKIKLQHFVGDIADAGFKHLEVAFSFVDQNALFCRRETWGDCFEPNRTDENWRFISEATEAVMQVKNGLSLVFDLANEGACAAASMPPSALLGAKRYVQTIARKWQSQFGDNWVMSCPNSLGAVRNNLLVEQLGEAGLRPKYVEVHNYESDAGKVDLTLDGLQKLAERLNGQAILGEMQYDSGDKSAIIRDWLNRHPQSRFSAMIMWPLRNPVKGGCQMDVAPPYAPGPLLKIKGGGAAAHAQ
jgi:hypothetical protein